LAHTLGRSKEMAMFVLALAVIAFVST